MTSYGMPVERAKDLRQTMLRMKIFEKDIKETFVRSSGPGGQNVNKVATCVVLVHLPTNIQIKSQQERSQGLNRYKARCLLVEKIEKQQRALRQRIIDERQKKKKQERKRSRASKEKMLQSKKQKSQKKKGRRRVQPHKLDELI